MTRGHERLSFHFGDLLATLVELQDAIDTHPAGTKVEDVLRALYERVWYLEVGGSPRAFFSVNAIKRKEQTASWFLDSVLVPPGAHLLPLDAVLRRVVPGSFTTDAFIAAPGSTFPLQAVIRRLGSSAFALDALIAARSFTLDAEINARCADAVLPFMLGDVVLGDVCAPRIPTFTLDAVIGTVTCAEAVLPFMLGEALLGETC